MLLVEAEQWVWMRSDGEGGESRSRERKTAAVHEIERQKRDLMGEKVEREGQIELFFAELFSFQAGFEMVFVSMVKSPIQLDASGSGTEFGLPRLFGARNGINRREVRISCSPGETLFNGFTKNCMAFYVFFLLE
ncbi:hypothetical protein AAC387_Pa02g4833 [Persea americana]